MKYLLVLSLIFHSIFSFGSESNIASKQTISQQAESNPFEMGYLEALFCLSGGIFLGRKNYAGAVFSYYLLFGTVLVKVASDPSYGKIIRNTYHRFSRLLSPDDGN